MLPSFSHIDKLYELEKGKHEKMSYNISEQVLHPQEVKKSSVKMSYNISEQVLHPQEVKKSSVKMSYNISEQVLHPQEVKKSSVKMSYNISEQVLHPQEVKKSSVKMAYNIPEQVLHPQEVKKSSVKMAEAVFHESTINALKYYASHGYNHFDDLASFTKIIRDWFNTLNVKSIDYGVRKRDERRNAVERESVTADLSYITKFTEWLKSWKREYQSIGLSQQIFDAAIRTCKAIIIGPPHYLFERYPNLNYILLGNVSSDFLEGRFVWWRQLCAGNYYNSVTQFLQAETSASGLSFPWVTIWMKSKQFSMNQTQLQPFNSKKK